MYSESMNERIPTYYETIVMTGSPSDDSELIVEGVSVGGYLTFGINLMIASCFDFIGFLIVFMYSMSHASRMGAFAGLGIVFIRHSWYMVTKMKELNDSLHTDPNQDGNPSLEDSNQDGGGSILPPNYHGPSPFSLIIVGYLTMALGTFLFAFNTIAFLRLKRIEKVARVTGNLPLTGGIV